jgi:hypothetical protein
MEDFVIPGKAPKAEAIQAILNERLHSYGVSTSALWGTTSALCVNPQTTCGWPQKAEVGCSIFQ